MRKALPAVAVAAILLGCRGAPLLYDVVVEPSAITPNQDGNADVTRISYQIGQPAIVSIVIVGPDGQRYSFREEEPRSPGPHEVLFGGVIDGQMLTDGEYTVRFNAQTKDTPSSAVVVEQPLSVSGGDTDPPKLNGLVVQPDEFTPNQDGLGDRVAISYRLDEPTEVRVWLETTEGEYITDILEEQVSAKASGEPGPHVYDYDAGVDADAPPPPDGDYVVVAEARDGAGNVVVERLPLEIREGGQPRAALIGDIEWSDTILPIGATLTFTVTVKNVGATPIRTRGPEPGHVYDNTATFNSEAPAEWLVLARDGEHSTAERVPYDEANRSVTLNLSGVGATSTTAVRFPETEKTDAPHTDRADLCGRVVAGAGNGVAGVDVYAFEADGDNGVHVVTDAEGLFCFEDLPTVPAHQRTYARSPGAIRLGLEDDARRTDVAYPYRWQLGWTTDLEVCRSDEVLYLCLPPGKTVEVTGGVRFVEPPFRRSMSVYLALMHEDVSRMHGPYNPERITIEY